MNKYYWLIALLSASAFTALAQSKVDTVSNSKAYYYTLSLEELMNTPVSAGTASETTIRETPGIVTVISEEDIKRSGARDLVDVLQLVPGVEFGADVQNYVGIGIRGLWGSEGKVSLFIDNHEYNELNYGTVPFGNHFPLDQIAKIEVIRGPGSAMYGGTSQFGVIKITTKAGQLNGIQASTMIGQMGDDVNFRKGNNLQRNNFFLQAGSNQKPLKFYFNSFVGNAQRSNRSYTDFYTGEAVSFNGRSGLRTLSAMTTLEYKGVKMSWWYDNYSNASPDYYADYYPGIDANVYAPLITYYNTISGNLLYEARLSEKFVLHPQISFKSQNTWNSYDPEMQFDTDTRVARTTAKLEGVYTPSDAFNLLLGAQGYMDNGKIIKGKYADLPEENYAHFPRDRENVQYENLSTYMQANLNTDPVSITGGFRYDKHSLGFDAFVPRLAVTRAFERLHLKLLGAQSFRTPYVMNYSSDDIKAEKATFFEFETGYKVSPSIFMTLNIYDITVNNQLYYLNLGPQGGAYKNAHGENGSTGGEVEIKYQRHRTSVTANYSYYNASTKSGIDLYRVNPANFAAGGTTSSYNNYSLGFAPHKFALTASHQLSDKLSFNVNGNLFSKRFGYYKEITDEEGATRNLVKKYNAACLVNLTMTYENLVNKGLTLTASVHNAMATKYDFITPYQTNHGALPSGGREYTLKLSYVLN